MELKPIAITGRPVGVIEDDRWLQLGHNGKCPPPKSDEPES